MNENTPMSQAQQLFAEEHHNLVYAFLKEKKLPEDEYYDVVVFGYLQAVMDYTTQGGSASPPLHGARWRAAWQTISAIRRLPSVRRLLSA